MVMMEEFRRRKNLKDYYELMNKSNRVAAKTRKLGELAPVDGHEDTLDAMH